MWRITQKTVAPSIFLVHCPQTRLRLLQAWAACVEQFRPGTSLIPSFQTTAEPTDVIKKVFMWDIIMAASLQGSCIEILTWSPGFTLSLSTSSSANVRGSQAVRKLPHSKLITCRSCLCCQYFCRTLLFIFDPSCILDIHNALIQIISMTFLRQSILCNIQFDS